MLENSEKRRPGRPRAADAGSSTRDVILEVALREFAQNGFDGVSITEIARQSDVAKALVHYHFSNKENLWKAAVNFAFREMRGKFEDIPRELQDLDPVSFLKVFIRRYVYFVARRPELGRIIIAEAPRGTKRSRWLIQRHLKPMHRGVELTFRKIWPKGPFKKLPFLNFLSTITGAVSIYFLDALVLREHYRIDPTDQRIIEQHADIVVETLLNGLLER